MTSRTASPLRARTSSPGWSPVEAAGEPGATATTRAVCMRASYGTPGSQGLVGSEGVRRYPQRVPVERVLLAQPRGYCAGVEMAIKALAWMVRVFEPPVYCYHEIVHNRLVVDRFRNLGVASADHVDEAPDGAPLSLSAHGSARPVAAA